MTYLLYGANGSGSSIVEATLAELRLGYVLHTVDAARGAHREAEYAAVNPHRKMPALVTPAGETLTESVAIVLTLAERHPEPALLPPPASQERARALRWMLFAATELYPIIEIVDYPARFSPDEAATPGVREKALGIWRDRWRIVEEALEAGPFVLGERFCATDIYLAALSRWDLPADWRAVNLPKVDRLAAAVSRRPALHEVWARHFPAR